MDFQQSIKVCFTKYSTFDGRATRSEFWWFVLFGTLVYLVAMILELTFLDGLARELGAFSAIVSLALLLPDLAVTSRRLHDVGRSGWWQLLALVPILGWIPLIYWLTKVGTQDTNSFGPPA